MTEFDEITARPWVIVGCGFTGKRLARRLLDAGATVWATRRSESSAAELTERFAKFANFHARALALDQPDSAVTLDTWLPRSAIVVHAAPPSREPIPEGQPTGEQVVVSAAQRVDTHRIVYVSSTGVYPPGDGTWVDEDSPVGPASTRGKARLAAETTLLDHARNAGIPAVSLRASGIYGPGRGVHKRLLASTYRIIGPGDTYVNRIHVDDLVTVIVAAALRLERHSTIYNVADDRPETSHVYANAIADILGVPRPPSVPVTDVEPWIAAMLRANRRISNARMKRELGITLAYPSWREGLRQVLAEDGIAHNVALPPLAE